MMDSDTRFISITLASWARLALVAVLTYLAFRIADIILILLTAIAISTAIEPILRSAKKRGVPRLLSVITIYAGAAVALSLFFYFLFLPLIGEVSSFVKTLTIYTNSVTNNSVLSDLFANQHVFGGIQTPVLMERLSTYLNDFSNFLSQGIFSTITFFSGGILAFVLILVLSFYLAVQDDGVAKFLKAILPLPYEKTFLGFWRRSQIKIGLWMQGQLLLGLLVAVLVYIGLVIIGVPNALFFAALAGLFELIPIFGPILSAIPPIFAAYGELGATSALVVAILFLCIQQVENHVIYPMVVKKVVGVPPIVSIIALFIGGELAGFLGILISVPVAVVVMEVINDYEQKKIAAHPEPEAA
jgi:predicted PurR-regulated permease PerM